MTAPSQQPDHTMSAANGAPLASPNTVRQGHLAMIAVALLVSTSFSVGSRLARDIPPLPLTFARFFLAVIAFAFVVAITRTKIVLTLPVLLRSLVPALIYTTYFTTMFIALETVSPLSTGAIFALAPVMAAFIGWLVLGRKLSFRSMILLLVAGMGAIWVVFDGDVVKLSRFQLGKGALIYAFGCLLYASYPTFVQKTNRGDSPVLLTFLSFVISMLLLFVYRSQAIISVDWVGLSGIQMSALLWLAVVPTAITFFLLQFASSRLPPAKLMAYTYLTPACIVPIEMLFGNGLPSASVIAGIVVTVAAVTAFELS